MMKAIKNIFIGLVFGAVIGWALGFLHLPYLEKNYSFFVGFISCLAFVAIIHITLFLLKKNLQLIIWMKKNSAEQNSNSALRKYILTWSVVAVLILAGGLLVSFLIYKENKTIESTTQKQNKKIREQSELFASSRKSSMTILLNDILDKMSNDLKNNGNGKLSDKTIANIVQAFNYSFTPYRYWQGDSLSKKKLSPEKGQLILALCRMNIDSISFNKIKLSANFSGADLSNQDLHGVDLSNTDLSDADLSGADLNGARLSGVDLKNANLFGVKANNSNFFKADMRRVILCWAVMNEARLDSVNMNGADLSNGQFRNAEMNGIRVRAAKLDGALLIEASLTGSELVDAGLTKTNMTRADLTGAYFFGANFKDAIMVDAELEFASVEKDWFERLSKWNISEAKKFLSKYKIVADDGLKEGSGFYLKKNVP